MPMRNSNRHRFAALALSAAVAGVALFAPISAQPAAVAQTAAATTQPDQKTDIPVRAVTLYSSGVGYFQHSGNVTGDATTELQFKAGQINDVLKSLVLQDTGGMVSSVTYASLNPLARTLKSFQVDITSNPSLADLLNQLRGAKLTLVLPSETLAGTILGVEQRTKPAGENKTIDVPVLNIVTGSSIRSVELPDVRDLRLDDPNLQQELAKALTALAAARDQDKKPVTIHFQGNGQRQVLLGYVVETPIWKTSYRLVVADKPAADQKAGMPALADGKIQGWAIVENQTDNDWKDVQLKLVSGRPISFVENLYQPTYIPRPIVQPQLYGSLNPQTYDEGTPAMDNGGAPAPMATSTFGRNTTGIGGGGRGGGGGGGAYPITGVPPGSASDYMQQSAGKESLDATASVQSVATAQRVGELFEYSVGSVSLPRQSSAMIPIVTDPIQVERVSIFNARVMPRNPLNGARMTNNTGKHLLGGPITIVDGSEYAGDAQIDDVPPGQNRLISYGVDLQMIVDTTSPGQNTQIMTGKIVQGVLYITNKYVNTMVYDATNKSTRDKSLIVEQPYNSGWTLVDSPTPIEKTDQLYRFGGVVPAGKQVRLTIHDQMVQDQGFAILSGDTDAVIAYAHRGEFPKAVQDALAKAAAMKHDLEDVKKKLADDKNAESAIVEDQKRVDENLRTVDKTTAYYNRLLQKLNDEETQLEKLRAEEDGYNKDIATKQKAFEDYLSGLNIG